MNLKPTILVSQNKTIFQTWFLEKILLEYFNVEILDTNKNYDKRSTVVVSNWIDVNQSSNSNECVLANKGIRHVIDHCWDSWDSSLDNSADFIIRPVDFMWINESLWYKSLGYNKLDLTSNPTRDFLLLMHKKRDFRTKLYNSLKPVLSNNIYSYVEKGIPLQNAQDIEYNEYQWQRYTDPQWYTDTRFSVVSESDINKNHEITVTEKTLKPCAFKHPSIIWGQSGTLDWQKRQGFETFEHCIDESYDTIEDKDARFTKVIEQIKYCIKDKIIFNDKLTKQKLQHNYNHFYNEEIVMNLFREQIINPLLEFINA